MAKEHQNDDDRLLKEDDDHDGVSIIDDDGDDENDDGGDDRRKLLEAGSDAEDEEGSSDTVEDDADLEERRRARREERRNRQQRAKDARRELREARAQIAEQKRILDEVNARLAQTEASNAQRDAVTVDQRLNEYSRAYNHANDQYHDAITRGDKNAAIHWDRQRQQYLGGWQQANSVKQRIAQQPRQPQQQAQQPAWSPRVRNMATDFAKDHPWFDPNLGDEDSVIVKAIDERLVQEGFRPDTSDYWEELRDRVKRRLPERFRGTRRGPAISGTRNAGVDRDISVDKATLEAWREAGILDDPAKLKRMKARYREQQRNSR